MLQAVITTGAHGRQDLRLVAVDGKPGIGGFEAQALDLGDEFLNDELEVFLFPPGNDVPGQ